MPADPQASRQQGWGALVDRRPAIDDRAEAPQQGMAVPSSTGGLGTESFLLGGQVLLEEVLELEQHPGVELGQGSQTVLDENLVGRSCPEGDRVLGFEPRAGSEG